MQMRAALSPFPAGNDAKRTRRQVGRRLRREVRKVDCASFQVGGTVPAPGAIPADALDQVIERGHAAVLVGQSGEPRLPGPFASNRLLSEGSADPRLKNIFSVIRKVCAVLFRQRR